MATENTTQQPNAFPPTRWSLVMAAGNADTEEGQKALGDLLTRYNNALVTYLIKKFFYSIDEAQDLVQDFILQVVLKSNWINKVQAAKGHQFRRFLLCSLHSFAISHYRRKTAQKRMPENGFQPLEHLAEIDARSADPSQTYEFDLAWARSVIAKALARMEKECIAASRPDIWGVFENRLRKPLLDGLPPMSYEELTTKYGFKSPAHAHNILVTAKRAFTRALEEVVGEYAVGKQAIDEEVRELQRIIGSMK